MIEIRIGYATAIVALLTLSGCGSPDRDAIDANGDDDLLPPVQEWAGASETLIVDSDDPWVTPSELTGLTATPRYEETIAWLTKLVDAAPELEMVTIGRSLEGRDIVMVIASAGQEFTPRAMRDSGKPLLLAQAGIHAGEIDGKDAGMMLLRDMTVHGKNRALIEDSNLLFIPILNVDGHERFGPDNRINQRGPVEMGWRTNARNQNLNRDYTKLDTAGTRAAIDVIRTWQPDLYLDLHVTDGADYQYDVTFAGNGVDGWSPEIGRWIEDTYRPAIDASLEELGHVPGPLVFSVNDIDLSDGFYNFVGDPRFSNGYGDARHLPTILVENHSLKPYRRRVLGTYGILAATLEALPDQIDTLRAATSADRARRAERIPLGFDPDTENTAPIKDFKGIVSERYIGEVSGDQVARWTGEPVDQRVPEVFVSIPTVIVDRPAAYIIPPVWVDIVERIRRHGVRIEKLSEPLTMHAEIYRLGNASMAAPTTWTPNPFEGRVRIDPGVPEISRGEMTFPAGSFRIDTDQELGDLVVLMLEPQSPDSFFQWGFFLEIFTRTEYAEAYVMEPLAERMMADDLALRLEFEQKLVDDPAFATDSNARLMWFYEKTRYYDQNYLRYPVARIPATAKD